MNLRFGLGPQGHRADYLPHPTYPTYLTGVNSVW